MKSIRNFSISFLAFLLFVNISLAQKYEISSPDGKLRANILLEKELSFSIEFNNNEVVKVPVIALELGNGKTLGSEPKLKKKQKTTGNKVIQQVVPYKDAKIQNHYNELILHFKGDYRVIFRAYNDGVAYRFVDENKNTTIVKNEIMELAFSDNASSYFPKEESMYSHNERIYLHQPVKEIKNGDFCSLPVMFAVGKTKLLFTEASLHDYPGMFLKKAGKQSFSTQFPKYVLKAVANQKNSPDRNQIIEEEADYIAKVDGKRAYPWRVFMISDDDRTFIESNLVTNLSEPTQPGNWNWVKPGKVAWDWYNANNIYGIDFQSGINTNTYKYYIDFASKNGIEYVILDEGWTKSTTEIMEDNENLDVHELIKYGASKNVGIILWVLWKPLNENMDGILKLYSSWGAKGIKVDFMQRNDQLMVRSYEKIAETAAKYQLMVNYHGAFKPAGIERKWPNVVNYEGVKGNENNKWSDLITPEHNVTIPFIRMAAGPMDYTPGSMVNTNKTNYAIRFERPMSMGTRCHQVAMYVVYEAPLQMMCESPSIYYKEQETVDFITKIPTVWDETRVLEAAVSGYVLIARRKGENWYIGAMTDWTPRTLTLDLSFLADGSYQMEVMKDGVNAHRTAVDYKKESQKVTNTSKIEIKLAPGGGWVGILSPRK